MNRSMNRRRFEPQDQRRYGNDDYSRYASPDYRESEYDQDYGGNYGTNRFDYRESGTIDRPGVSGKKRGDESWVNTPEYNQQRGFIGKGPKGYKRTDDRIYEEVCEALMRSPDVDATNIGVKVQNGIVTLEGQVENRGEKRTAEMAIEDLPGVLDVRNQLNLSSSESLNGHEQAVKKDLGVDNDLKAKRA